MRPLMLATLVIALSLPMAAQDSTDFLPAGLILTCTTSEKNFSLKTAEIGDPLLCSISNAYALGRMMFPRGSYISGHLDDAQAPGHFIGKGWMNIVFDRLVLPGRGVVMLDAKVVSVPGGKVSPEGVIEGKGHPKRDAVEWAIPVLWPFKILTLPERGPYPSLKGEKRIKMRLMEDVALPPLQHPMQEPMPSPVPTRSRCAGRCVPTLSLLGGNSYQVQNYWVRGGTLYWISVDGATDGGNQEYSAPVSDLDLNETVRINQLQGIIFTLKGWRRVRREREE